MPLRTEQNTLERAVRQARQAATLEHKTGPASEMAQVKEAERKSKERLAQTMRALTDDEVRYLATTVMLRTPDVHAGATGAGAAWAVASRIANEMGSSELKRRKGVSSAISPMCPHQRRSRSRPCRPASNSAIQSCTAGWLICLNGRAQVHTRPMTLI